MILQQCRRKVVLGCFGGEFDFVSPLDSMQAAFFGRGQALVWRAETDPKGPETTRRAAGSSYCHVACPFMWPPWSCEKHHTPTHGSLGHTHRTKKKCSNHSRSLTALPKPPCASERHILYSCVPTEGLHSTSTVTGWWFQAKTMLVLGGHHPISMVEQTKMWNHQADHHWFHILDG